MPKSSSIFVSKERDNCFLSKQQIQNPSFLQYQPDFSKTSYNKKEEGTNKPFGVNEGRFRSIDHGVPGVGSYKLPDSCQVKQSKYEHASLRSTVPKGLNQVIGKNNPGIG